MENSMTKKLQGADLGLIPLYMIFVNEHLTYVNRTILNRALALRRKGMINKLRTGDGQARVR